MDRQIDGRDSVSYLWNIRRVVPFLKVDKGLAGEHDGVQIMNPINGLASLLSRAKEKGVFGTKMRLLIKRASHVGIKAVVDQQFDVATRSWLPIWYRPSSLKLISRTPTKVQRRNSRSRTSWISWPDSVWAIRHPEVVATRRQRLLCRPGKPPEDLESGGALGRIRPGGCRRAPGRQPRRHRQFLARPHRGVVGTPEQSRI
jgi:hypothetical protein